MAGREVTTEDEAWAALAALLESTDIRDVESLRPAIVEWAKFSLDLEGSKFQSTITPPVMEMLLTLQSAINRSAALLIHGTENATLLTDAEKERVEISAHVSDGSSKINVDGTSILNHLIDMIGASMSGTEMIILVLGVALLYFGHSTIKDYFAKKAATKERELSTEQSREIVRQIGRASEQETERTRILMAAINREPRLVVIKNEAEKVYDATLRSIAESNMTTVQGVTISGTAANDLVATQRSSSRNLVLSGTYRILSIDTGNAQGFRVRLRDMESNQSLVASLKDALLSEVVGHTIRDAFWARRLVRLKMEARLLRGQVRDAVVTEAEVLDIEAVQDDEDGQDRTASAE